jgi:hypothetical protein
MVAFHPPLLDDLRQTSLKDFEPHTKSVGSIYNLPHICADLFQMVSGMCSVRAGDAHRLKTQTARYASLDPSDPQQRILLDDGNSKADRGFNHPKLARFLLPVAYLEEYDEDRTRYVV